jgi:hypothetical protein
MDGPGQRGGRSVHDMRPLGRSRGVRNDIRLCFTCALDAGKATVVAAGFVGRGEVPGRAHRNRGHGPVTSAQPEWVPTYAAVLGPVRHHEPSDPCPFRSASGTTENSAICSPLETA